MKKVKFIYNPASGDNGITDHLDDIVRLHQEKGYSVMLHRMDFKAPPQDVLYDLGPDYHHVMIAGGDGTVNFVVDLLKNHGHDIPVAILPSGTANDFATALGLNSSGPANDFASALGLSSSDPVKMCRRILDGRITPVDLGKANGSYFVNVFSCGLLTEVSQKTPTILKNTLGRLAYYVEGLGELSRFRKINVSIRTDNGDYEGSCIIFFVFNGRTAGGLRIAYLSQIDDGMLDVLILKGDNPFTTISTVFLHLSRLRGNSQYPAGVEHIRCRRIHAMCATPETTDIDGQPGPAFPVDISCEKGALKILKPE